MKEQYHPRYFKHFQLAKNILGEHPILSSRIKENCGFSPEDVPLLLTEVFRFLNLIAYYGQRLTPAKPVDDAWHEFILFTAAYGEFCQQQFGKMIHHYPGGSKQENHHQFKQTLAFYQEHFGDPPVKYWGNAARLAVAGNCGGCEAF